MTARGESGATLICRRLERLGVTCVFGVPGTQLLDLFEALRRSRIRTVLATSELSAAFMANGYARASGKPGVLITISGPGFAYSVPGLAEAFFDSAPLLHIVNQPPAHEFAFQKIHQQAIAHSIVKAIYNIEAVQDIQTNLEMGLATATTGEPGPVMIQVAGAAFCAVLQGPPPEPELLLAVKPVPSPEALDEVVRRLRSSSHTLIYCGQGANGAPQQVQEIAERLHAPVVSTRSARGIVPEDHPLAIVFNSDRGCSAVLNRLLKECELVLALGCKLSRSAAPGFQLPPDKLIHVDAAAAILNANYPASLAICADVPQFLSALVQRSSEFPSAGSGWRESELSSWKQELHTASTKALVEPSIPALSPPTPGAFFAALGRAMPRESCLVTDSGQHQILARIYARIFAPRGMIIPSDFQSMGFGLPAAIGAKLAMPERTVVALIGDGSFAISGLELASAVREKLALTVIVFNDRALGLIRTQQLAAFGRDHATQLCNPDYSRLAESFGIEYFRLEKDPVNTLARAIAYPGVSIVEVVVAGSSALRAQQAKGLAKGTLRQVFGPSLLQKLRAKMPFGRR